jgi:hypothetical protein
VVEFDEGKMLRSIISEQPDKMVAYGRKNRTSVTQPRGKKAAPKRRLRQCDPSRFNSRLQHHLGAVEKPPARISGRKGYLGVMRSGKQLQLPSKAGASCTTMVEDDLGNFGSAVRPSPITLQFSHEYTGG